MPRAPGTPGASAAPERTETVAPLASAAPGASVAVAPAGTAAGGEEAGAAPAVEPEHPAEPAAAAPGKKGAAGDATGLRAKPRSEAAAAARQGPAGAGVVTPLPAAATFPQTGPLWTRGAEVLPYKVVFLGITMGYARFSFLGRVLLGTREAYHLRVRAWTSDLLSLIYPIDERIDYYLDIGTLLPLRQEFRSVGKKNDVAIYDQQQGTIVYRYIESGKVRKRVDVVPDVYDPVSLAYYIRTRNIGAEEERGLPMYAGRKVWDVTAKPLGYERVRLGARQVETVVVEPVLRREGKPAKKSDMRMWITRDARHVPVRIYAKFRKFRTWTLVGELLPDWKGG